MADITFKARPTVYNGIRMRSRLEAGYAAWLDYWHFDWEYEPYALAGPSGQYLPDFKLNNVEVVGHTPRRTSVFVETKPAIYLEDRGGDHLLDVFDFFDRAVTAIATSDPDALLIVEVPRTKPTRLDDLHTLAIRLSTTAGQHHCCQRLNWCCPDDPETEPPVLTLALSARWFGPWQGKWWAGKPWEDA